MTASGSATGPQQAATPAADARVTKHGAAPGRSAAWLERALDFVNAGPRPSFLAMLCSMAGTSLLSMALAEFVRQSGPLAGTQRHIFIAALAGFAVTAIIALYSLAVGKRARSRARLNRVIAPRDRTAIWLALAVWFPLLLLVVYYRARATFPAPAHYLYSPFDDKRWITAAYLIGTLAPAVLLITAARVISVGYDRPATWRAWFAGLLTRSAAADQAPRAGEHAGTAADTPAGGWWTRLRVAAPTVAGIVTALALAWYFVGPSWYVSDTTTPITGQEDVWLSGLQAIATGHLPYVGPAIVPYGPGMQLATYLLMHHVTSFSIVGLRQAWALQVFAGTAVLFVVFFLALGYARGLAVTLLTALVYPALRMLTFQPNGMFDGYFGWYSPLRYVGMITLVMLLPGVIRRSPSRRGAVAGALIGALWGLTSYMAQENLAGGVVGVVVVAVILLFSGSVTWRAVRSALIAVLAGFVVVWLPVLGYYAVHGALGGFLGAYLLFPQAVAAGINDTPWGGFRHAPSPYTRMFDVLPWVLAAVALLTMFEFRPLRIATRWSRERSGFFVTVVATVLLYQGVLLRSDQSHLTGTLLLVPGLVIMTGTRLPRLLGARRRVTAAVAGVALVAASFWLLPKDTYSEQSMHAQAYLPYHDRVLLAADPTSSTPTTVAGLRVGPGLSDVAQCCQAIPTESMPAFIRLMEQVHQIVGKRTAYVANVHGAYVGLIYFVADLDPAPIGSFEYDGSTLTEATWQAYLKDFRTRVLPQTQALLTYTLSAPEAEYFLSYYPHAREIKLHFANSDYYVLLSH